MDLELPHTRALIQAWLDQQGKYPPEGAAAEYCVYIEACYPIEADRSLYFQQWGSQAIGWLPLVMLPSPGGCYSFHLDNEL